MINKKKLFFLSALAVSLPNLVQAQLTLPLGPYGSGAITFKVDSNGLLSDTGTYGTGTLSLSGTGTRMFWYPGKAAFRAGYAYGAGWDDSNIGNYSTALGSSTTASGLYSVAMGQSSTASGGNSVAIGSYAVASGSASVAFTGTASNTGSVAFSNGNSSGWDSLAMGYGSMATGSEAIALGYYTTASGAQSVALSTGTATGGYSMATGYWTIASGSSATALGSYTKAQAYGSLALGQYNVGGFVSGGDTSWISTDPLLELGNGTDSTHTHDALVVYKNGNASFQGVVTVAAGGDIPMFTGN